MRPALLATLCAAALTMSGCRSKEERSYQGRMQAVPDSEMALVELAAGTLVAVHLSDGSVKWRYQVAIPPSPYLDFSEEHRLVCPIVATRAGDLVLRYDAELHVVAGQDGRLRWKRRVRRWARNWLRCPAAAADSGVVLLRQSGLRVQKLNADGSEDWAVGIAAMGAAIAPPTVSPDTGDVLIETASHLVNISPEGAINWARPRKRLAR